jgi:restriction system protein
MASIPAQVRARQTRTKKDTTKDNGAKEQNTKDDTLTSTEPDVWRQKLLSTVLDMSPPAFEKLCQLMLREAGFTKVEVTGRSGDGGIDGIGVLRVALLSFQVFFQCKRYRGSVSASAIRDFRGAMVGRTDKGLLITTGTFTTDAKREATRDGAPVLDLIDGEALCDLLKQYKLGVNTEQVEAVTIQQSWFRTL